MERVQLAVDAVTRKRVALSRHGERTVRNNGEPEQLRFEFIPPFVTEEDSVHAALGYTEWLSGRPPCMGWWEVRFKNAPEIKRLWWAPRGDAFVCLTSPEGSLIFDGSEVAFHEIEYRGLKQPDPRGYDYPVEGFYKARIPVRAS